jgi:hypothetical protein
MAKQITGAGVFHISTTCEPANQGYRYSDHDPYLVGINLGANPSSECRQAESQKPAIKILQDGRLIIVQPDGKRYNVTGVRTE